MIVPESRRGDHLVERSKALEEAKIGTTKLILRRLPVAVRGKHGTNSNNQLHESPTNEREERQRMRMANYLPERDLDRTTVGLQ